MVSRNESGKKKWDCRKCECAVPFLLPVINNLLCKKVLHSTFSRTPGRVFLIVPIKTQRVTRRIYAPSLPRASSFGHPCPNVAVNERNNKKDYYPSQSSKLLCIAFPHNINMKKGATKISPRPMPLRHSLLRQSLATPQIPQSRRTPYCSLPQPLPHRTVSSGVHGRVCFRT